MSGDIAVNDLEVADVEGSSTTRQSKISTEQPSIQSCLPSTLMFGHAEMLCEEADVDIWVYCPSLMSIMLLGFSGMIVVNLLPLLAYQAQYLISGEQQAQTV